MGEMHEVCIPCAVYNFLCSFLSKSYESLRFCAPIISSFLYVTLLIFPWLVEIMVLSQCDSTSSFVNTILFCATVQTGLSISSAVNMGYNFFCCCADSRLTGTEVTKMVDKSRDRECCSSPMKMKSLVSSGYIIFFGAPWLLVNICALGGLPDDMCFSPVLYLIPFIPLIVYFPCFAVGSAYRNLLEMIKLDRKLKESPLSPLVESDVKCDAELKPLPMISSDVHTEPLNSPNPLPEDLKIAANNQQLYNTKPLMLYDVKGASSKAIFNFMKFGNRSLWDYPIDVDDFERNRALLLHYPEWREKILEMGTISRQWKALSENWRQIEQLYEKDYLIYRKLNPNEGECNKYIHKLLKDA